MDLCREIGVRKRLEDDLDARIEASLMDDGVSGVPGRIEDFEPRLPSQGMFGELATIHAAWEPDIGEKQADFAVGIQQTKSARSIRSAQHGVSKIADHL